MPGESRDLRQSPRLDAGDPIRVVATIAVVMQHVAHAVFRHPDRASTGEWAFSTVVVSLTEWAVPVFVMLSGALLLESRPSESLASFYRKRFKRVGIPLLFWTAFYLCLSAAAFGFDERIWTLPERLLEGRPFYHMYFLFILAGLYLFAPMLRRYVEDATRDELRIAMGLSLGIAAGAAMLGVRGGTALTRFVPFVGYFLAGWWIRSRPVKHSTQRWHWAVFFGATVFLIGASLAIHDPRGLTTAYLHDYLSVPLILMSLSLFTILMEPGRFGPPTGAVAQACAKLSPLCFGIYLIHPALLRALGLIGISGASGRVEVAIPLVSAIAFAASAGVAAAMRRVRPLSALIGG